MAQVKPSLTLDVNVGPSSHAGIGGSGTSMTPRAHQNAVNQKALAQMQASAYAPQTSYDRDHHPSYVADSSLDNEADQNQDNSGFSSDDDAQDAYAAANSRLKAGSSSAGSRATRDDAHGATQQHQYQQSKSFYRRQDDQESYSSNETDEYGQDDRQYQAKDGDEGDLIYEEESDEGEEGDEIEDDESEMSSSPSIPDENIDFDLVYALHNFVATVEGQATVHKGNSLTLLDDSNSYWWLVRVLRTQEVGYIPAENIETPFERLARLNKHRNVDLTSATQDDHIQVPEKIFTSHLVKARHATGNTGVSSYSGKLSALSRRAQGAPVALSKDQRRTKRGVVFGPPTYLEHSGDEYSDYEEEDEDEEMEYEEDPDAIYEDDEEEYDEEAENEQESDQHHSEMNGVNGMEPDDGMDWDGGEAERIQQQHEANNAAMAHNQYSQDASNRDIEQSQTRQQQQQQKLGQDTPLLTLTDADASQVSDSRYEQQQYSGSDARLQTNVSNNGKAWSTHEQRSDPTESYAHSESGPPYRDELRLMSNERPVSSVGSSASHNASNTAPGTVPMSRNSTMSNSSFLPSHIQRERAGSDASATSSAAYTGESTSQTLSAEKDKRKSNRSSKGADSIESTEERSSKKRSGVFSLFSRKDKKDRKSITSEDRDSIVGRNSDDSFAGANRDRSSPASGAPTIVVPEVQAANAGLAPGQSIGMGRAVQERDRAQQEAYQRQFLSAQSAGSSEMQSGDWSQSSDKKKSQRPGSLVGPSGSTPMLSVLRVFAGEGVESESTFKTVLLNDSTRSTDLQRQALQRFGVPLQDLDRYVLTIKRLEGDERPLDEDEHPLQLFNDLTHILQEGQITIPSVKRSSVGSISSISSNLSAHPAIARLGNDFSDDHAVKFYISRRDRLGGYVDLSGSGAGDVSARSAATSDVSGSHDTSDATLMSFAGLDPARSSHSSVMSVETADTVQSPTARFSLRLLIFASDLPESTVFDPQSSALIPSAALKDRLLQRTTSSQGAAQQPQQQYREKILTFPRNTTVAEVVEEGLDRFGIAEGVVEGGDDVEDRPSRRKGRLHVKYGLAVRGSDGDRALHATSRILDAYQTPPTFKLGVSKRRSIDAAALLGASNDIGSNDPVFVLRQVINSHKVKPDGLASRTLSPTEQALAAKQRGSTSPAMLSPRMGDSRQLGHSNSTEVEGQSRQGIIAAQRAAAAEKNAAVLGAQKNAQEGVDVMLSNRARIRSSKLGSSNKFRYSYLPADGQERDISSIIEEILNDPGSIDSNYTSSRDTGLRPQDAIMVNGRPGLKNRMQSDMTVDDYASARSSSRGNSPLSLNEVHYDLNASSVAPLSLNKQGQGADASADAQNSETGDLLISLIKRDAQSDASSVDSKINAVLNRVQSPTVMRDNLTNNTRTSSRSATTSPATGSTATRIGAGAVALGAGAVALAAGAVKLATDAVTTQDQAQSEPAPTDYSGSRGLSSPALIGLAERSTMRTTPTPPSHGKSFAAQQLNNSNKAGLKALPSADESSSTISGSRTGTPRAARNMVFGADDQSLSHLYTIVDAAARRDPRKHRLMTHGSMSSITSASPVIGSPTTGMGSRPGSKLSTFSALMSDDRDVLKAEPGGLFAPAIPFMEDKKLREAYSGISRELGSIDDGLDQLLADIIRIF